MSDLDQIINGEQPEPEAVPEEVAAEPVAQEAEIEAAQPEPEAEEPAKEPEPEMVPASVVGGLRSEIRELKAVMSQANAPEPEPMPDIFEDATGAIQHQLQPIQQQLQAQKLQMSRFHAEREFGKEVVNDAFEFFNENPGLSHALLEEASPFHAAVDIFNQHKVAKEIGNDPEAWRNAEREKMRAEIEAELVAKQAREVAASVAPSMANLNGTGGGVKPSQWDGPTPIDKVIGS